VAWSTRELAELAGTTVKAVRHYHKLNLLDEPERKTNGYKQYEVAHLIRLLQITRLADLGLPLAQIATMGHADQDPDAALLVLDKELSATVDRLQRIRSELAVILKHRAPAELPAGFGPLAGELSENDRSIIMIYSRVFDESVMQDIQKMIGDEPRTAADDEFDALPADADRATRQRLAEALAPAMARAQTAYPSLQDTGAHAPKGAAFAQGTVVETLRSLYSSAQLEVLYRGHLLSTGAEEELAALEAKLDEAELAAQEGSGSAERSGPLTTNRSSRTD
jgi:DNA-binding transcriptional MerR regulator